MRVDATMDGLLLRHSFMTATAAGDGSPWTRAVQAAVTLSDPAAGFLTTSAIA